MKKIYCIILLLIVFLAGCKGKTTIIEEKNLTSEKKIQGITTSGNCYLSDTLICINAAISPEQLNLQIKNLEGITLASAFVTAGNCKSDAIDVDNGKIVTFTLNNCPSTNFEDEFYLYYKDDGKLVSMKGSVERE